jgi:hypothetical protein
MKPILKDLVAFNKKSFVVDKGLHNWKKETDISLANAWVYLSMHYGIQFHPRLRKETKENIFGKDKLKQILLTITGGVWLSKDDFIKYDNVFFRIFYLDTLIAEHGNADSIADQKATYVMKQCFTKFSESMLNLVNIQQVHAWDERLQSHGDKRAPGARQKGKENYGYWLCQDTTLLIWSGLPIVLYLYPLLNYPHEKKKDKATGYEIMRCFLQRLKTKQANAKELIVVFDRYYSTKAGQQWLYENEWRYITQLKSGEGGGWYEYVWLITAHEGRMNELAAYGSSTWFSPYKGKKNKFLSLQLVRTTADYDRKLFASNCMNYVGLPTATQKKKRKAKKQNAIDADFQASRMQSKGINAEYCYNFSHCDIFNTKLSNYGYKQGVLRKGAHWWCTLWYVLLDTAILNTIHIYIEAHGEDQYELNDDWIKASAIDRVDVAAEAPTYESGSIEAMLSADVEELNIGRDSDEEDDVDVDVAGRFRKKLLPNEERVGCKTQTIELALKLSKLIALKSGKVPFYTFDEDQGKYVARNAPKKDSGGKSRESEEEDSMDEGSESEETRSGSDDNNDAGNMSTSSDGLPPIESNELESGAGARRRSSRRLSQALNYAEYTE